MRPLPVFLIAFMFAASFQGPALRAQGNHGQIEEWYERGQYQNVVDAVVPDPNAYPHSIFVAGRSFEQLDRLPEARQEYERLLAIGGAWYYLGTSNMKRIDGDWSGAAADALTASQMENFDITQHNYGYHLARIGDYAGAGTHFDSGLAMNPGYTWGFYYSFLAWWEVWEATGDGFYRNRAISRLTCYVQDMQPRDPRPAEYYAAKSIYDAVGGGYCNLN